MEIGHKLLLFFPNMSKFSMISLLFYILSALGSPNLRSPLTAYIGVSSHWKGVIILEVVFFEWFDFMLPYWSPIMLQSKYKSLIACNKICYTYISSIFFLLTYSTVEHFIFQIDKMTKLELLHNSSQINLSIFYFFHPCIIAYKTL